MELSKQSLDTPKETQFLALLKNKQFIFLWIASTFSSLALSIYLISESWYVVQQLKLDEWLGIVMMASTIPRVILMTVGGVFADKVKRSHILFFANTIRGFFIAVMVIVLTHNLLSVSLLICFALIYGVLDAFYWPSSNSFVPLIVQKQQITRANSVIQTTNQIALLIGPAIAGLIMKLFSFQGSFSTASILLILSGLFIIQIRKKDPIVKEQKTSQQTFFNELKEGIYYIKKFPFLMTVMATSIVVNLLLVGPVNIGLPLLVKHVLKGDVLDLSFMESAFATGMVLGALITGIVNFKKKRAIISISLVGLLGITSALLGLMTSLLFGLIVISISGIALGISNILSPSITQELVDSEMMGRVQSFMSTASMGFTPISFALVSMLISMNVSIQIILFVSCSMMSLFCLLVLWKVKVIREID